MRPIYQADGVLDAFAALLADGVPQREGVALVMLGAGYAPSPHLAARAHSLAEQYPGLFVFHTQQLSPTEMAGLWHLADVLVNVPIFDGYSAALSEARYMGAIPVVNAIAAHHELLRHGHNALFVPQPFTPAQLAHTLAEALAQREALQARFWAANRQWVKQYANLANNAQEFLALCSRHFSLPQ
jgi:glycosyltransferase involved in cell wall biosynthesis